MTFFEILVSNIIGFINGTLVPLILALAFLVFVWGVFRFFIFDTETNVLHQVTSGFYNDGNPAFSTDGLYLFLTTNRSMSAVYSDLDGWDRCGSQDR